MRDRRTYPKGFGWIYVATHPLIEGFFKIGMTSKLDPHERLRYLQAPGPAVLEAKFPTDDRVSCEQYVLRHFATRDGLNGTQSEWVESTLQQEHIEKVERLVKEHQRKVARRLKP